MRNRHMRKQRRRSASLFSLHSQKAPIFCACTARAVLDLFGNHTVDAAHMLVSKVLLIHEVNFLILNMYYTAYLAFNIVSIYH